MNKKISTPIAIAVVLVCAILVGGLAVWCYFCTPKVEIPEFKPAEKTPPVAETADWKIYRNEKYGLEFRHPTTWKVDEDAYYPFLQLQVVDGGKVVSIAGGISIISKETASPYIEMFTSNSRCPDAAGSRNLSSPTQYEEYVYCLTGKEITVNAGTWKGTVECSASWWYMGEDFNTCPHQFWIDTKDFFYVVHFNFFQPIEENSDEAVFFEKFLRGFSFFVPRD